MIKDDTLKVYFKCEGVGRHKVLFCPRFYSHDEF